MHPPESIRDDYINLQLLAYAKEKRFPTMHPFEPLVTQDLSGKPQPSLHAYFKINNLEHYQFDTVKETLSAVDELLKHGASPIVIERCIVDLNTSTEPITGDNPTP